MFKLGVGRGAFPIRWDRRFKTVKKLPRSLPNSVVVSPEQARRFCYAGRMTSLFPLCSGIDTYIVYTDYKSDVCLFQRYDDQAEVLLCTIS